MPQTIPQMFIQQSKEHPDTVVQLSKDGNGDFQPTTYSELLKKTWRFAAGLRTLGVKKGDRIGMISDNRAEWLEADLAILGLGASDVPRGCDATV